MEYCLLSWWKHSILILQWRSSTKGMFDGSKTSIISSHVRINEYLIVMWPASSITFCLEGMYFNEGPLLTSDEIKSITMFITLQDSSGHQYKTQYFRWNIRYTLTLWYYSINPLRNIVYNVSLSEYISYQNSITTVKFLYKNI